MSFCCPVVEGRHSSHLAKWPAATTSILHSYTGPAHSEGWESLCLCPVSSCCQMGLEPCGCAPTLGLKQAVAVRTHSCLNPGDNKKTYERPAGATPTMSSKFTGILQSTRRTATAVRSQTTPGEVSFQAHMKQVPLCLPLLPAPRKQQLEMRDARAGRGQQREGEEVWNRAG